MTDSSTPTAPQRATPSERQQRIAEIEARLNAATPGPWYLADSSNFGDEEHVGSIKGGEDDLFIAKMEPDGPSPEADTALIFHAPSDIAWLIAELRATPPGAADA